MAKTRIERAMPHTLAGIDATLTEGASIAGIIRGRSAIGPGLKGACVQANGIGGQLGVSIQVHTGVAGRYALHGLGTGRYDVSFAPCNAGNYLSAATGGSRSGWARPERSAGSWWQAGRLPAQSTPARLATPR